MYNSILKSLTMANDAIARIEMPSEKDLVSDSNTDNKSQKQKYNEQVDDDDDVNDEENKSNGELEFQKKALRSHD